MTRHARNLGEGVVIIWNRAVDQICRAVFFLAVSQRCAAESHAHSSQPEINLGISEV